ncbi:hypothetical protein [Roseomonas sp. USHLN139]|uniref:hypothetical protein n=1 Tax=Roseomonas sp. USHLN139 TaxID=3081298 RepID=UPI003B029E14
MTTLTLGIEAQPEQAELVATTIEQAALTGARLDAAGARALARAAEETFAHVVARAPGTQVDFALHRLPHAARLDIAFAEPGFDPAAFNLTHGLDLEGGELEELALLIASRSVDRFDLSLEPGEPVRIRLEKDRPYPPLPPLAPIPVPPEPGTALAARPGSPAELRHLARLLTALHPEASLPPLARRPDRLAEMAREGAAAGILALAPDGRLAGGLLWQQGEGRIAEFHGPWIFSAGPAAPVAEALVEAFLGELARSRQTTGVFGLDSAMLPDGWFEPLGGLLGGPAAVFRSLEEDSGAIAWADPALRPFLEEGYDRLALAREIREAPPPPPGASVLAAGFDRAAGEAVLRPVLAGADAAANVAAHVALLAGDGIARLTARLDLGRPLDACFIPALLGAGFQPRYLVPAAGRGDVLVLQHPRDRR